MGQDLALRSSLLKAGLAADAPDSPYGAGWLLAKHTALAGVPSTCCAVVISSLMQSVDPRRHTHTEGRGRGAQEQQALHLPICALASTRFTSWVAISVGSALCCMWGREKKGEGGEPLPFSAHLRDDRKAMPLADAKPNGQGVPDCACVSLSCIWSEGQLEPCSPAMNRDCG